MKTVKRSNLLVVVVMLAALAIPAVSYAQVDAGSSLGARIFEMEITGALQQIGNGFMVVNAQSIRLGAGTEVKGPLSVGDVVKVHVRVEADGSLVAREVELARDRADDNANDAINGNGNANANDNLNDNANDSLNDNSNGNDDDSLNDNSNDNDDDSLNDNSNGNGNDDDDDDNSNGNDDHDDDNSNRGRDDDDDNSGKGRDDD